MTRESLRARLSRWLAVVVLASGACAGVISFGLAFDEAHGIQDTQLRDIAELVATGRIVPSPEQHARDTRPEAVSRIHIERQQGPRPLAVDGMPLTPSEGFRTIDVRGNAWRVYVSRALAPDYIVVAQRTDARDEIARDSALRTIVPMLGLLPVLLALSYWVVRRALNPVATLAGALDRQEGTGLSPLQEHDVPEELLPFVTSINRLMQRVNAAFLGQRRFVGDAAHELRTPLAALSMQLQNLERASSLVEMRARAQPLKSGIERAGRLVEQLLSLARQQSLETTAVTTALVDWTEVTRRVVEELHGFAETRGVDMGVTRLENTLVNGDAESFHALARNAIDNALRYTPAGGRVDVRVYTSGSDGVLEVEDTGPGIAAAELERVFEAFYRVPGSPGTGTGLGLAIVRDIARRNGGHLSLTNVTTVNGERSGMRFRYTQA